jgi:hypothetical protein
MTINVPSGSTVSFSSHEIKQVQPPSYTLGSGTWEQSVIYMLPDSLGNPTIPDPVTVPIFFGNGIYDSTAVALGVYNRGITELNLYNARNDTN